MASTRKRQDLDTSEPIPQVDTREAALVVLKQLMKKFSLHPAMFRDEDSGSSLSALSCDCANELEHGIGVSSSKVTYASVAPLVGLETYKQLRDIPTFEVHRSRIPTHLFKAIVMDMDDLLIQYGPPFEHRTEESRSRFLSPIVNHLVKQFAFMLRNNPENAIGSRTSMGTPGIKYFINIFGSVTTLLYIEMKLEVENNAERLKVISQIIAECLGCDDKNSRFSLPIHCIFSHGLTFEIFKFERKNSTASFMRGCTPGDPKPLQHGLNLVDLTTLGTSLPSILQLRCACEMIFDVMLSAYIAGVKAFFFMEKEKGFMEKRSIRPSLDELDLVIRSAECALAEFREAEGHRKRGDLDSADATTDRALLSLQKSTGAVPTVCSPASGFIMDGWDEIEVRKG